MNKTLHILSITLLSLNIALLASNDNTNNNNLIINNNDNSSSSSNSSNNAINTNSTNLCKQFLNKLGIKPNKPIPRDYAYYDDKPQTLKNILEKNDHVEKETRIPALTLFTQIKNSDTLNDNLIRMFIITKLANGIIAASRESSSSLIGGSGWTTFRQAMEKLKYYNHDSLRKGIFDLMDAKPQYIKVQEFKRQKKQTSSLNAEKKWLEKFKKQLNADERCTSQALAAVHNNLFEQHKEQLTKDRNKTQAFIQPFITTLNSMIDSQQNNPTNNLEFSNISFDNDKDEPISGTCVHQ